MNSNLSGKKKRYFEITENFSCGKRKLEDEISLGFQEHTETLCVCLLSFAVQWMYSPMYVLTLVLTSVKKQQIA